MGFELIIAAQLLMMCLPHDDLLAALKASHDEMPIARTVASGGYLLEVLTSSDGSTWSIVATNIYGCSKIVAEGFEWQILRQINPEGDM